MCHNTECRQEVAALQKQMAIMQIHIEDLQRQVASHHDNGHRQHQQASRQDPHPYGRTGYYA